MKRAGLVKQLFTSATELADRDRPGGLCSGAAGHVAEATLGALRAWCDWGASSPGRGLREARDVYAPPPRPPSEVHPLRRGRRRTTADLGQEP
jgi:hypothetical protein